MSTSKKLDELTYMVILLQNTMCGLTLDELSYKLERPRRAIERMMEILREKCGDKLSYITFADNRKKHWKLQKSPMNFGVHISDFEIAKLKVLTNGLKNKHDIQVVNNIIEKIKILNPQKNYDTDIETLLSVQGIAVRQQPKEIISSKIAEDIEFCLLCQLKLKLLYKDSSGNTNEYIVEPYGIKIGDSYYLIAKENGILKTFKFSRILKTENLNDYYVKDEDFDIKKYCEQSFGVYTGKPMNVVLQFCKNAAEDAANYDFHPTQKGKLNDDGSYTLSFCASGSYEIITEILKWRDSVRILSPKNLKNEYNETIKKMYKNIKV